MPIEFQRPDAPFAVARVELSKDFFREVNPVRFSWRHCYNVVVNPGQLNNALLDRAISLARTETAFYYAEDDLDSVPAINGSDYDPSVLKLTHALEHIAVSEIAKASRSSTLWLLEATLVGGIPAQTRLASFMGYNFPVFSFEQGFAETPQDEIRGVVRACEKVLEA